MKLDDDLRGSPLIRRHPANPLIHPDELPIDAVLAYNPGVAKWQGRYVMLIRADLGSAEEKRRDGSYIVRAYSDDGLHWEMDPEPTTLWGSTEECPYDPRITVMDEGWCCATFAHNVKEGLVEHLTRTTDFRSFERLHRTLPENRDVVMFPRRIGGLYWRLDRPFPLYQREGECFSIWCSCSPDLRYWGDHQVVLSIHDVPWANRKLGAGTPPVATDRGWLVLFHGVDEDPSRTGGGWEESWKSRYSVGAMLLDLENPAKVVGVSDGPVMVPEAPYEVEGNYRNWVVFPTGLVVEGDEARIYYGAADTSICLATARLDDLVGLCLAEGG